MDYREAVRSFAPTCEQEEVDRELMLSVCGRPDILLRSSQVHWGSLLLLHHITIIGKTQHNLQ